MNWHKDKARVLASVSARGLQHRQGSQPRAAPAVRALPRVWLRVWLRVLLRVRARLRVRVPALLAPLLLAACSLGSPLGPELRFQQPVVLLGEVHDNATQHAWRLRAFEAWLAQGGRPALLMEQLDRERQPAIDQARQAHAGAGDAAVSAVIAAGGPAQAGWDWAHYRPFVALALRHGLAIVAVNVSRDAARQVMRQGLAANGFDAAVPADILQAQVAAIVASHCGMVDEALAGRMALAQVARDQAMARAVDQHAAGGVLLLAGNGHVRRDLGVPRWLNPATLTRSEAIGLLEPGDASAAGGFDRVLHTAAQSRDDPCAAMQPPPAAAAVPAEGQPGRASAPG